jgi:hypothetical protein
VRGDHRGAELLFENTRQRLSLGVGHAHARLHGRPEPGQLGAEELHFAALGAERHDLAGEVQSHRRFVACRGWRCLRWRRWAFGKRRSSGKRQNADHNQDVKLHRKAPAGPCRRLSA